MTRTVLKMTSGVQLARHHMLAIECTEQACSVALSVDGQLLQIVELAARKHAETLLPLVDQLLVEAGLLLTQLDAIAFSCGPGSFTGLRIATGVVQGLAYGAELPVVPVSSLAALAHSAFRCHSVVEGVSSRSQFLVALDARMNEVYVAPYRVDKIGKAQLLAPERVCLPEHLKLHYQNVIHGEWIGAGSGWCYRSQFNEQLFHDERSQLVAEEESILIEAQDVLLLAFEKWLNKESVSAELASPVYLRDTVSWKKLPGRE